MTASSAAPGPDRTNHGKRVIVAWIVLSCITTPLVAIFLGPALPPGNASTQATEQVFDNTWMTSLITPILCLLLVFFVYALSQFRHRGGALVDGPPLRDDPKVRVWWIVLTSLMVLFFAGFGTYELEQNGAGGGQGPSPVAVPSLTKGTSMLPVQVIAQQWQFTYRYPTLGGFETPRLYLPENTYVAFHVTSLDAVHSFWAYELGVKADANPGVDNIAYVQTKGPELFHVRCAELCGLWHGYMFNNGHVVSQAQFTAWVKSQRADFAPIQKYLTKDLPYAKIYFPDPQRRAG